MNFRRFEIPLACLIAIACSTALAQAPKAPGNPTPPPTTKADKAGEKAPAKAAAAPSKDEDAIRKSARDFMQAFEKADAKAIAAMWTDKGEYENDRGQLLKGREAIEKAYDEVFKEANGRKMELVVKTVRFPAADLAIEEGILRESGGKELPTSSGYETIHVRDGGQWKIARSREWGGGQDHLDDLNWLVGKWKGGSKDDDLTLSFAWDEKQPVLVAHIEKKTAGKPAVKSTIKVGFDPRRGQLRSWHSDDDGGQGQSLWARDGNRWLMTSTGLTTDGKSTSATNVLSRIDNDHFLWSSTNRMLGDQPVPDTAPVKLSRVVEGNGAK
jgi:uncharacterized protein (TIGR02246 family)